MSCPCPWNAIRSVQSQIFSTQGENLAFPKIYKDPVHSNRLSCISTYCKRFTSAARLDTLRIACRGECCSQSEHTCSRRAQQRLGACATGAHGRTARGKGRRGKTKRGTHFFEWKKALTSCVTSESCATGFLVSARLANMPAQSAIHPACQLSAGLEPETCSKGSEHIWTPKQTSKCINRISGPL